MPKQHLNYTFVKNATVPANKSGRVEYYDTVVKGLLLRVTSTGHKSFVYRYGQDGKRYTIGTFPEISLSDARDIAKDLKAEVRQGGDPQADKIIRRNAPKKKTVSDLAQLFKKKHLPKLKESTRLDYIRRIDNFIIPKIGKFPVNKVERYHVIELLEEIAEGSENSDPAPIQSNRVRAILSSMYNFGINRAIAEYNPVTSVKPMGKENQRKRVYSEKEIRTLWENFEKLDEPYHTIFKILLLCGQRAGETRMMRWDEIDENGIWTIPEEKTKAGRVQKLPLPPLALELINKLKMLTGESEYVFESPVIDNTPVAWLQNKASDIRTTSKIEDFRIHDLRRTAASYMAELGIDRTVLGKVLNHKGLAGDNQVTAIYDRHEYINEKQTALITWNNLLEEILNNQRGKILQMNTKPEN